MQKGRDADSRKSYAGIKSLESFPAVCIPVVTINFCICEHKCILLSLLHPSLFSQFYFLVRYEKQFTNRKIVLDASQVQYYQHNC